mmetsp:Transcript_12789/g.30607  ORF Transcript_12789/g.30607 Transcript_12789/m.30607 type:complete len:270 (+) Transcript_12789:876-1685(+)
MICLIIEAPLANCKCAACFLDKVNHLLEIILLDLVQPAVVFGVRDVQLVLRLGLRGLKGTGEESNLGIIDNLRHLRVGKVLIDNNSMNQASLFQTPSNLLLQLDKIKIHILALNIGNCKNSFGADAPELLGTSADHFAAKGSHGSLHQSSILICKNVHILCNLLNPLDRDVASLFESISNAQGVQPLVEQLLGLLQQSPSKDHHTGRAISNLMVLGPTQLHKQLGCWMFNVHLLQDSRPVIGHCYVSILAHDHLVHSLGSQGRGDCVCN